MSSSQEANRILIYGKPTEPTACSLVTACRAAGIMHRFFWPRQVGGTTITRSDYLARFGDDIDFAAVGVAKVFTRRTFSARAYLDLESHYYGRLRAIAAECAAVIDDFRPDFILVHSAFRPVAQIVTAKALRAKIPPLFVDGTMVPGDAFVLDARAIQAANGRNSVDTEWDDAEPLTDADRARAAKFISEWQTARSTKLPHREDATEAAKVERFMRQDSRPTLLLAMQAFDFNTAIALPDAFAGDYGKWLELVLNSVPPNWKVVAKKHPSGAAWFVPKITRENQILVDQINLRGLLDQCAAIISLSSNVGLEAALACKPAIVCGKSHYGGKGLALDITTADYAREIPSALEQVKSFAPPTDALARYVCRAILDYQIWSHETDKFLARLSAARDIMPAVGDVRCPFFDYLPANLRGYAQAVNQLATVNAFEYPLAERILHWWRRRSYATRRSWQKRFG